MGALDNIRVIDFGHYVAGPVAGMLLADQGAGVIKVDPPGGPVFDSPANATWNRGKRSICLNLKDASDRATAKALARSADVLIENFRPGVMKRLGLDQAELRAENPALIFASMPGFAPEDPRSSMPAWEGVVLAATDVFRPIAEYRDMMQLLHRAPEHRVGPPVFTAEPFASMYAALVTTVGITSALIERRATGRGQKVEVPLFDAMIQALGILGMSPVPFKPITTSVFSGFDHQYQCADGRWIHLVFTVPRHAAAFARAVGRTDLIERGMTERGLGAKTELNRELTRELTRILRSRTAREWESLFVDLEIPGAMCRSTAEWLQHPQAIESDLILEVDDPLLGPTRQPGLQVKLSATPGAIRRPAPRPDEHREEILNELEAGEPPADPAQESRSVFPLEGLRVLDLCIILAGPTCGRTLAELGADVIKIDDPNRGRVLYHHDVNRGKRSLLLDLGTADGKEIFWQLADTADVIVQNFRSGVVEKLGIDYESLRSRKPDIVYASLNAYGDEGPWSHLPGYEESVQALTGIQTRFGGADKPILWPYGVVNDYGTGYAGAFGVLLALLVRAQTGVGQHVSSALARTACTLQSTYLQDYAGKEWREPTGPDASGLGPLQRLYECSDGWIFVGVAGASLLEPLVGRPEEPELENRLASWCLERTEAEATAELRRLGAGAHPLSWFNDVMSEPIVEQRKLSLIRDHEKLGLLRTTGPGPWFSDSKIHAGRPAPLPGSDAESVLADIGRQGDLSTLVAGGAVRIP